MILAFFNWFIIGGRQHIGRIITSTGLSSLNGLLAFSYVTDRFPQNLHMIIAVDCFIRRVCVQYVCWYIIIVEVHMVAEKWKKLRYTMSYCLPTPMFLNPSPQNEYSWSLITVSMSFVNYRILKAVYGMLIL